MRKTGGVLFFLGSALLSLLAVRGDLVRQEPRLAEVFPFVGFAGVALVGVAALVFGLSFLPRPLRTSYFSEPVAPADLEAAHGLIRRILGDNIVSLAQMRALAARNPNIFYLVKRSRKSGLRRRLDTVGFFALLPLTAEAQALMERDVLTGSKIMPEHVRPSFGGGAVYIGGLGGLGWFGQGHTRHQMVGVVSAMVAEKACDKLIATPISDKGRQLVADYDFVPCRKDGGSEPPKNYCRSFPQAA